MELDKDLPLGTLLKLREEVGLKKFREFEQTSRSQESNSVRKEKFRNEIQRRRNYNEDSDEPPFEMSSKKPVKQKRINTQRQLQDPSYDPRFSQRCGKFNEEKFKKNYQFAFDLKDKELLELKESQKKSQDDAEEQEKRKYLIQRMENQKRESLKKKIVNRKVVVEVLPSGDKFYKNKKQQRAEELVNKFIELKNAGNLEKHLDKRRKKLAGKERKRMNIEK